MGYQSGIWLGKLAFNTWNEFFVAYFAVTVFVGLFHDFAGNSTRQFDTHLSYLWLELSEGDLACIFSVKVAKDWIEVEFTVTKLLAKVASNEFIEIYIPIFVHINAIHYRAEFASVGSRALTVERLFNLVYS